MDRKFLAQRLLKRLDERVKQQLNLGKTLILGVVLKGLPVAFGIAKSNKVIENFVPLVAQRQIHMQHQIESYFPSREWITRFRELANVVDCILIVDDVVNAGFTRQKVESIVHALARTQATLSHIRFAALVLNRKKLANPSFARPDDIFALEVNAYDVECDWGLMTVPLWDLPVDDAIRRCDEYYEQFWTRENRWITVHY
jgi:adenine/guanine phosphoribosyltransferase-like PRPP-binding protein